MASCRSFLVSVLVMAAGASLFSDYMLAGRSSGAQSYGDASAGAEDDPLGLQSQAPGARLDLPPAASLGGGDEVIARVNFLTDSMNPVAVAAGTRGIVLQVDGEGDVEIAFLGGGREWVYGAKFGNLAVLRRAQGAMGVVAGARAQLPPEQGGGDQYKDVSSQASMPAAAAAGAGAFSPAPDFGGGGGRGPQPEATNLRNGQPAQSRPSEGAPRQDRRGRQRSRQRPEPPRPAPAPPPAAPAAPPPAPRSGPYKPIVLHQRTECLEQAFELGSPRTVEECDALAVSAEGCGRTIMFAPEHYDWKCRCCAEEGADGGPPSEHWNVYQVQSPPLATVSEDDGGGGKDKYVPQLHAKTQECDEQALDLGTINSVAKCDAMVAAEPKCGAHFQFSKKHPDWHCRCCSRSGADDGAFSPFWDVYVVQAPLPENRKPVLPAAMMTPTIGLPVAEGPRPSWLVREDALVIDARPQQHGGILILQAVLMDASKSWGKKQGFRPRWLRAILAANREHARRYGHAMVLRVKATEPQLTDWQRAGCGRKSENQCRKDNERENYNWEKHLMLAEYLNSDQQFTHVLMLDADAAFIRQDHNTLQTIMGLLDSKGKDLFLTDEDWLENGAGRINGGLIMAKNSQFTRDLFQDTFDAHISGPTPVKKWRIGVNNVVCSSNEQICLNDLWKGGRGQVFSDFTMMEGGKKWNFGAEKGGFNDPNVEILHFMGGAKSTAGEVLCDGSRDVTGEGRTGYGCQK